MPIESPGDVGTVADLGLPRRAVTALTRAGITDAGRLALLTRHELTAVPGLGPGSIAAIRLVVPEPPSGSATRPDPEAESPDAPAIPSFDSLRAPRRRSALDLLVPPAPEPAPAAEPSRPAPRPAEYGDLLRLGLRLVRWSLHEPVRLLHRLLG